MKQRCPYEAKVFWSEEDGEFIAAAPVLPGCSASGKTREAALRELETAMELWLESRRESDWAIPKPIYTAPFLVGEKSVRYRARRR